MVPPSHARKYGALFGPNLVRPKIPFGTSCNVCNRDEDYFELATNDGFSADSGPYRSNPCRRAFRPSETIAESLGDRPRPEAGVRRDRFQRRESEAKRT
jgi:hypothetical protein